MIVITAIEVIALYLIIYAIYGIMPFGDKMLYTWDLHGQYSDFFVWYRNAFLGKTDIRYSLIEGFGGGTASFFAYYLASPFNLILLFFNQYTMPTGVWILIMLKLVAMAVSMAVYTYSKRPSVMASLCGVCYAACGYVAGFGSNVMWLDAMIFLPWVIWGLEDLLYAGKVAKYSVFLGLVLLANFYTGYMVCFFVVVYFVIRFITYPRWKAVWQFIYGSILGGMLSAVLLIPTFMALRGRGHYSSTRWDALFNFTKLYRYRDTLWAYAPGHFRQVQLFEINNGSAPLLYIGVLPALGIVLMLLAKHLSWRDKLANIVLLALVQISFNHMNIFTILHGMDTPQGAPWRYAFLWSFAAISVGYEGLVWLEGRAQKKMLRTCGTVLLTGLVMVELAWNTIDTWNNALGFDSLSAYLETVAGLQEYYNQHQGDLASGKRTDTMIEGMRDTNDAFAWNVASTTGYTSTVTLKNEAMMPRLDEAEVSYQELPLVVSGELTETELRGVVANGTDSKPIQEKTLEIDARHISNAVIDLNQQGGFAKDEDTLTITVPYENNWKAFADGKRIKVSEDEHGFLKLQGVRGAEAVRIHYTTRGLGVGAICSLASAAILLWLAFAKKKLVKSVY